MGSLTLHDLHEQNIGAMQRVVELGRQLGRPIFTSLWSSRADRPSVGSGELRRDKERECMHVCVRVC